MPNASVLGIFHVLYEAMKRILHFGASRKAIESHGDFPHGLKTHLLKTHFPLRGVPKSN
jgi:hypothetical protein